MTFPSKTPALFYMLPDSFKVVTLEMLIFKITVTLKKKRKNTKEKQDPGTTEMCAKVKSTPIAIIFEVNHYLTCVYQYIFKGCLGKWNLPFCPKALES